MARLEFILCTGNADGSPFGRYVLSAPGAGQERRLPLAFRAWLSAEAEEDRRRLQPLLPTA
ncbi:hypothetical protein [Azospirillum sp.]|uniref:hypothetical protein n=1 Tax=Azospirillum sp. TaxID=34012 RepID=UPI00260B34D3|nr:hypothetical protein [Azospirillum sp.]